MSATTPTHDCPCCCVTPDPVRPARKTLAQIAHDAWHECVDNDCIRWPRVAQAIAAEVRAREVVLDEVHVTSHGTAYINADACERLDTIRVPMKFAGKLLRVVVVDDEPEDGR